MFGLIHYDLIDNALANLKNTNENFWFAQSNARKNDDGYEIEVELPGLSRSDINVEVVSSNLKISASRENKLFMFNEFSRSQNSSQDKNNMMTYEKTWRLPEETNFEGINAKYEAGILRIEVPVKRPNKRKISVE